MEQEKGFNPTFENGGYWEYYKDLERQFGNFLESVPYLEGNEDTYSFRLANLILAIGAHVDSALNEIAKYSVFSIKYPEMLNPTTKKGKPRKPTIKDYYPISEEYKLTKEVVTFKCLPDRETVKPFLLYQRESGGTYPDWWNAYNKVKHNFSKNFKKATLKTVRDALAGAFLLNVIHPPAADRLADYGLVKPKYAPRGFEQKHDKFRGKEMQPVSCSPSNTENPYFIETELFIYDYEKLKGSELISPS
jgi:hypothetical protein